MSTPEDFLKWLWFFSGTHDVALIEIVAIRCYFNNNFILIIMILMNKVVRHILLLSYTLSRQIEVNGKI